MDNLDELGTGTLSFVPLSLSQAELNLSQDYNSNPPSLCFLNSTSCGQGNVPTYGVNATTTAHIQVGTETSRGTSIQSRLIHHSRLVFGLQTPTI